MPDMDEMKKKIFFFFCTHVRKQYNNLYLDNAQHRRECMLTKCFEPIIVCVRVVCVCVRVGYASAGMVDVRKPRGRAGVQSGVGSATESRFGAERGSAGRQAGWLVYARFGERRGFDGGGKSAGGFYRRAPRDGCRVSIPPRNRSRDARRRRRTLGSFVIFRVFCRCFFFLFSKYVFLLRFAEAAGGLGGRGES